jgi:hypothetical protein
MLVRLLIITLIGLSLSLYFPPPFPGSLVCLLLFTCGTRAVPPPFRCVPTTPRAAMLLGLFECPFDSVYEFTRFLNFWVDFTRARVSRLTYYRYIVIYRLAHGFPP